MYQSIQEIKNALSGRVRIRKDGVDMLEGITFQERLIDSLVYSAVFNDDPEVKNACEWIIWETGIELGVYAASISELYKAKGKGEIPHKTIPAINIRSLTYDTARALIRSAKRNHTGAFILEIARSEIDYTLQSPSEYATVIIAAAIAERYQGPIFLQGDHFQIKQDKYKKDPQKELSSLKQLIKKSVDAGFYNIDIDTSTMVDMDQPTVLAQQENNIRLTAEILSYIRGIEPIGITISIGGEIGEIGGTNSTEEELREYIKGLQGELESGLAGISKISIQTGTVHGGIPLSDGTLAQVRLDFDTLSRLSHIAIEEFGLAGAVQHGASTLPIDTFHKFPDTNTAEIHLATQFQNILYEMLPMGLKDEIYEYLQENFGEERKEGQSEEQFIYKVRKKGLGPFKQKIWDLHAGVRTSIGNKFEEQFDIIFEKLRVTNTMDMVRKTIKPVLVHKHNPMG
ncbi:aldolase [Candidatus Desantisbacteria bacterium CG2_30_40_21]|uniref:Aldolase n=4 Tax=unclassified Candidatus Desantisiibacteriota TaxID=3106372 RepID=A0A2M7P318_9BACT|nr:MAG: aldolase [Candidatus Desantisbacteria bacterium CG2_30_40_21]PIP42266.1 MAG: aldolase [Candidatus Desantisbacteria bacterium CG23_combo_of_CG06-09_8_20_14_all_40_23]PIY19983.1 MAG: aldolase [Candidatus Desantisbacteria bacterium CG_4_10_14_3_um_filter_40_18]PJB30388.1 MAG: aldolase [Candidatus Desantisbacteria bacterium CG_4_9_14_3_um_filter_40_11]